MTLHTAWTFVLAALVAGPLLLFAFKGVRLVVSNLLARRALEYAGFVVPRTPGFSYLKGHLDLFIRCTGQVSAVIMWLRANMPELQEKTFSMYLSFFFTMIVSTDPDVAYQVLHKKNYDKQDYETIRDVVGNSLLTANGEPWARKRRIMNHGFKPEMIKSMVPTFAHYARLMCDMIERDLRSRPEGPQSAWIDMAEVFSKATLDIIGDVAFGHKFNFTISPVNDARVSSIKEMVYMSLSEPAKLLSNPLRMITHPRRTYQYYRHLRKFKALGMDIVRRARTRAEALARADSKDAGDSILGLILKMGTLSEDDKLSESDLLDEIMTFLVAGHETTAGTASFALLYLAKHPDCLAKAVAEVDSILLTRDAPCGYEEQHRMDYLLAVFREVLRLHPVAPAAMRIAPAGEIIDGKVLKRPTPVFIPYVGLHRNRELWGADADEFRPERWLGASPIKHPMAYVPFSNGPRICIGKDLAMLEFRVLMATFLRRFRWRIPRDLAYRDDVRDGDPDCSAEPTDRAALPPGFEVAYNEQITQRPRECVVEILGLRD
ncbi:cytochrome P450 [Hyaloraphidium curvatum]|nr:cytochrome P450 [Hyaloraphidium curvatum]